MKIIVSDEEGNNYSVCITKVTSIRESRRSALADIVVKGKMTTFFCHDSFWDIANAIKRHTWEKLFKQAGVEKGPWV